MTIPQTSPRMFGDLYYANNIPTYVGEPIDDLDKLGESLETKYYTNQDNMDKFTTLANSTEVRDVNNPYLNQKIEQARAAFQQFHDKGDYENADGVIRKLSRDFTSDRQLQGIIKDKQQYDTWLKDLNEKEEKGIISSAQKKNALLMAQYNNQEATVYDPVTQSYQNVFSGTTPPKYQNIPEKITNLVKILKEDPNKAYTQLQKSGLAFKYKYEEIENLSEEQLRKVATEMIENDDEVKEYLKFETQALDFKNRLGYDEQGKLALRPYTEEDLIQAGILDAPKVKKRVNFDENGKPVYVDANGKEYNYDQVTIDPVTGKPHVAKTKTTKSIPVTLSKIDDVNFVKQLYNPDGTLNQSAASQTWSQSQFNNLKQSQANFAENFAFNRVTPHFEDDTYGRDIAKANYESNLRRQEEEHKLQLEAKYRSDPYIDLVFNWEKGIAEKTESPEVLKTLFGDKVTADNAILMPNKKGAMADVNPALVSKLPQIMEIKNLQKDLESTLANINTLKTAADKAKTKPANKRTIFDDQVINQYTDALNRYNKTKSELDPQINELKAKYNISDADLNNPSLKTITEKQKKGLAVLGKLLEGSADVEYTPTNKNNVRRVNNGKYADLLLNFTKAEAAAALTSVGKESGFKDLDDVIQVLNEIYDLPLQKTGSVKGSGEASTPMYQLKASVPIPVSSNTQRKFNQSFGVKHDRFSDQNFIEAAYQNQSLSVIEAAEDNLKKAGKAGAGDYAVFKALEEAGNAGVTGKAKLKEFMELKVGKAAAQKVDYEKSQGDPETALFIYSSGKTNLMQITPTK